MDIVFASNKKYAPHLATALISLLSNNRDLDIFIHLLSFEFEDDDKEKIVRICDRYSSPISIHIVEERSLHYLKTNLHFSRECYLRLLVDQFLDADTCLYLDSDLIVRGSIASLGDIKLNDYFVGAVDTPGFNRHSDLGMKSSSRYFNSGVMLINLCQWRAHQIGRKVIDFVENSPSVVQYVDQCGLNAVIDGHWLEIDSKYNVQTPEARALDASKFDQVLVAHFTGSSKPWNLGQDHPFRSEYWKWRRKTGYQAVLPDDFSLRKLAGYGLRRMLSLQ
ncbi:MAG: glycosyltransferase family 8 protein [Pseudomonadota bacterium]